MNDDRSTRTLPADLITPVGAYLRLCQELGAPAFLLESVERGEQVGRHSFLGAGLRTVDSLDEALAFAASLPGPEAGGPPFGGGAVGFLSYDWVGELEPVPVPPPHPDDAGLPRLRFMLADSVVAFDHVRRTLSVTGPRETVDRITSALEQAPAVPATVASPAGESVAEIEHDRYLSMVERAKEHIAAGDAFQILPSQRIRRPTASLRLRRLPGASRGQPVAVHVPARFRRVPAVGSSPETHVRLGLDGECELRPIAGTRPRGATPRRTRRCAAELMASAKERAEHVMLVDLARNDLGRVCVPGSIRGPSGTWTSSATRHVMHIVSRVVRPDRPRPRRRRPAAGDLPGGHGLGRAQGAGDADHLRARGPPPRARMRAPSATLASAATWTPASPSARSSCATDVAYLQSGGGVVADSDPEGEYQEAMNKAGGPGVAIDRAETGVYGP